ASLFSNPSPLSSVKGMLDGSAQTLSTFGSTSSPAAPSPAPCAKAGPDVVAMSPRNDRLQSSRGHDVMISSSLTLHARFLRFGGSFRLVCPLAGTSARDRVERARTQVDVEVVHVAVDVLVLAESGHHVFLARAQILPAFRDDRQEGRVIDVLHRLRQRRRVARTYAVGAVADVV